MSLVVRRNSSTVLVVALLALVIWYFMRKNTTMVAYKGGELRLAESKSPISFVLACQE